MSTRARLAAAVSLTAAGCLAAPATDDVVDDTCVADWRTAAAPVRAPHVHHGTDLPREVTLSPGQRQAIGTFGRCTGTLIAARWVLSARHCVLRVGDVFRFGDPATSTATATAVLDHPTLDLALVELDGDAADRLPGVAPIPWLDAGAIDLRWLGRPIEGAGFGAREDGGSGLRRFVAAAITAIDDATFTIDGQGRRGLCSGDSGGPALVIADDASVRVAGALSRGSASCVDRDHFARVDRASAWIAAAIGAPPVGVAAACGGGLDHAGRCVAGGAIALHCGDDGRVQATACAGADACGWRPELGGYRCTAADPCGGVDTLGRCDGATARWCAGGVPAARACAACDARCVIDLEAGGATCVADPCAALDERGACAPDGARIWCADGERFEEDCPAQGTVCRDLGAPQGHQCV